MADAEGVPFGSLNFRSKFSFSALSFGAHLLCPLFEFSTGAERCQFRTKRAPRARQPRIARSRGTACGSSPSKDREPALRSSCDDDHEKAIIQGESLTTCVFTQSGSYADIREPSNLGPLYHMSRHRPTRR